MKMYALKNNRGEFLYRTSIVPIESMYGNGRWYYGDSWWAKDNVLLVSKEVGIRLLNNLEVEDDFDVEINLVKFENGEWVDVVDEHMYKFGNQYVQFDRDDVSWFMNTDIDSYDGQYKVKFTESEIKASPFDINKLTKVE
jgi:hypothetical protein